MWTDVCKEGLRRAILSFCGIGEGEGVYDYVHLLTCGLKNYIDNYIINYIVIYIVLVCSSGQCVVFHYHDCKYDKGFPE